MFNVHIITTDVNKDYFIKCILTTIKIHFKVATFMDLLVRITLVKTARKKNEK